MESALREHAGTVRELASRWLDSMLSDPVVRGAGGDVVCSPAGLWLALAALATGAEGDTAEELADLVGVAWRESAPVVTAVARDLAATDSLAVATGVWSRTPVRDEFRSALPDIQCGPFVDAAGVDAWLAHASGRLIETIGLDDHPRPGVVLVNALALKVRWRAEFDAADTLDRPFHAADDTHAHVPMMARDVPAADVWTIAGRDGDVTVVELACAGEAPAVVRFALGPHDAPPASVITAAWAPRDTGKPWDGDEVTFRVPRLELRTRLDVVPHLVDLGVKHALDRTADFQGLTEVPAHLERVVQESLLRVAEQGVEAAAVTTIRLTMDVAQEPPRRQVCFDRPFACVVMDASGYVPLFAAYQATTPRDAPDQGL